MSKRYVSSVPGNAVTAGKDQVKAAPIEPFFKIPANPNRKVFRAEVGAEYLNDATDRVYYGFDTTPIANGTCFAYRDGNVNDQPTVSTKMETTFKGDIYFTAPTGGPFLMTWVDEE